MDILISGLSYHLEHGVYEEFENRFGIGPCGAYAALMRQRGWGDIAVCIARPVDGEQDTGFTHYVIVQDGGLIDLCNPLGEELVYTEIEILDPDEMPDLVDEAEIEFLDSRIPIE